MCDATGTCTYVYALRFAPTGMHASSQTSHLGTTFLYIKLACSAFSLLSLVFLLQVKRINILLGGPKIQTASRCSSYLPSPCSFSPHYQMRLQCAEQMVYPPPTVPQNVPITAPAPLTTRTCRILTSAATPDSARNVCRRNSRSGISSTTMTALGGSAPANSWPNGTMPLPDHTSTRRKTDSSLTLMASGFRGISPFPWAS